MRGQWNNNNTAMEARLAKLLDSLIEDEPDDVRAPPHPAAAPPVKRPAPRAHGPANHAKKQRVGDIVSRVVETNPTAAERSLGVTEYQMLDGRCVPVIRRKSFSSGPQTATYDRYIQDKDTDTPGVPEAFKRKVLNEFRPPSDVPPFVERLASGGAVSQLTNSDVADYVTLLKAKNPDITENELVTLGMECRRRLFCNYTEEFHRRRGRVLEQIQMRAIGRHLVGDKLFEPGKGRRRMWNKGHNGRIVENIEIIHYLWQRLHAVETELQRLRDRPSTTPEPCSTAPPHTHPPFAIRDPKEQKKHKV